MYIYIYAYVYCICMCGDCVCPSRMCLLTMEVIKVHQTLYDWCDRGTPCCWWEILFCPGTTIAPNGWVISPDPQPFLKKVFAQLTCLFLNFWLTFHPPMCVFNRSIEMYTHCMDGSWELLRSSNRTWLESPRKDAVTVCCVRSRWIFLISSPESFPQQLFCLHQK